MIHNTAYFNELVRKDKDKISIICANNIDFKFFKNKTCSFYNFYYFYHYCILCLFVKTINAH